MRKRGRVRVSEHRPPLQGILSHFKANASWGNQKTWQKPPGGKLTGVCSFFSSSSNSEAAWHSSRHVSPAASPVSTDSISGVRSSHRNEGGRQERWEQRGGKGKRRKEDKERGRMNELHKGGKSGTKLRWRGELVGYSKKSREKSDSPVQINVLTRISDNNVWGFFC